MESSPVGSIQLPAEVTALLQRHNLLRTLLRHHLVDEHVKDVSVSEEERTAVLQQYCQQQQLADAAALEAHLEQQGLREVDLRWLLELPLRKTRFALERFGAKAEQRFLERKNNLDRVVYSLLRVQDSYLARELYLQISEGESNFADLAARYSQGSEQATRGVVGPVPMDRAHPVLVEKLRSSEPGHLLEPFSIGEVWLVVRLERYVPAQFDQAMAQQMSNELFELWVNEELAPMVARFQRRDNAFSVA